MFSKALQDEIKKKKKKKKKMKKKNIFFLNDMRECMYNFLSKQRCLHYDMLNY